MPQLFPSGLGVFQKERKEVTLNLLLQVEGELDFYSPRGRVIDYSSWEEKSLCKKNGAS